jgi:tetratricopeptide (TPR) repeat protein
LSQLTQMIRSLRGIVSRRSGQAMVLIGQPGIGKTFTAVAILREVACAHLKVHATVSIVELLKALPRAERLPNWVEVHLEHALEGQEIDAQTLMDVLAANLAALAPFVLCLEDVHEASPERLELIRRLAVVILRGHGVGLLMTSRSELPKPVVNHQLQPLELAQTQGLLEQQLGAALPSEALNWMYARTQGNPLFTQEFLRYLRRQGSLWSDGLHWHWRAPEDSFVPVTVEALIEELTTNMITTPAVRAALEARTMLPAELESMPLQNAWAAVAGLDLEELASTQHDLEHGGLLRGDSFAHPLFGEVIAQGLHSERRQVFARRAYEVLGATQPMLAVNFLNDAGLEPDQALEVFDRAVAQARSNGHGVQAYRLLANSLVWRQGKDRSSVALEAAHGLYETNFRDVEKLVEIALEADPENTETIYFLIELRLTTREGDAALGLLDRLSDRERSSARCWERRIKYGFLLETWEQVKDLWFAHPEFHVSAPAMAIHDVAFAHHFTGDQEGAFKLAAFGLERAGLKHTGLEHTGLERTGPESTGLKPLECCDLWNIQACALGMLGRDLEAIQVFSDAIDLATPLGAKLWVSTYHYNRSFSLERQARLEEAIADAETCVQLRLRHGSTAQLAHVQANLGRLLVRDGQYERAEAVLLETMALQAAQVANRTHVESRLALCELYLAWEPTHGPILTRRYATSALEIARNRPEIELLLEALEVCITVELRGANPEAATLLLEEFAGLIIPELEPRWLARLWFAQAQVSLAIGRHDEALAQYQRAVSLAETSATVWLANHFGLELDCMTNDLERARERLAYFEAHGLHWLSGRARKLFPDVAGQSHAEVLPEAAEEPRVRLSVLGPIQLEREGQNLTTRAKKRLELLVYLLESRIAGRSEASLLELLETFYHHQPERESKNTLRQQIHLIRTSLGKDSILSTPNGYRLGAVSSDAEEFLQTGDVRLWRGTYLENLSAGWHSGVRDALSLGLRNEVESLLEPDPANAVRLGRILVELEPYDLETLRLYLLALRANDQDRFAQKVFGKHRERLYFLDEEIPESLEDFLCGFPALTSTD